MQNLSFYCTKCKKITTHGLLYKRKSAYENTQFSIACMICRTIFNDSETLL